MMFEMFLIGAFAAIIWAMVCNNRTYRDRVRLIEEIAQGDFSWRELYKSFDNVSYDQHLWYRITLRNPKRLYKL